MLTSINKEIEKNVPYTILGEIIKWFYYNGKRQTNLQLCQHKVVI